MLPLTFLVPPKNSLVAPVDILNLPSAIQLQIEKRPLCGEPWCNGNKI